MHRTIAQWEAYVRACHDPDSSYAYYQRWQRERWGGTAAKFTADYSSHKRRMRKQERARWQSSGLKVAKGSRTCGHCEKPLPSGAPHNVNTATRRAGTAPLERGNGHARNWPKVLKHDRPNCKSHIPN